MVAERVPKVMNLSFFSVVFKAIRAAVPSVLIYSAGRRSEEFGWGFVAFIMPR